MLVAVACCSDARPLLASHNTYIRTYIHTYTLSETGAVQIVLLLLCRCTTESAQLTTTPLSRIRGSQRSVSPPPASASASFLCSCQPSTTALFTAMSTTTPARRTRSSAGTAGTTNPSPTTPSSRHGMTTRSTSRLRDQPPPTKPAISSSSKHDEDEDDDDDDEDGADEDDDVDDEDDDSAREQEGSGLDSDAGTTSNSSSSVDSAVESFTERRLGVVSISVAAIIFSIVLFALLAVAYNIRSLARKGL